MSARRRPAPEGQLAFDLDEMIHEADVAAAPPWAGRAPLHFTVDYYTPAELEAAWNQWIFLHGHFDSIARSRMWHPGSPVDPHGEGNGHSLVTFHADLRCKSWLHDEGGDVEPAPCSCVGSLLTQGICEPCEWHLIGSESQVVESWHDHAWPGWRELPVMPVEIRVRDQAGRFTKPALAWVEDHYPANWQVEGAPVVTDRGGPTATRHVPGYSPWGGFDLSDTALRTKPATTPATRQLPPVTSKARPPAHAAGEGWGTDRGRSLRLAPAGADTRSARSAGGPS